jgi:hypothetical protein
VAPLSGTTATSSSLVFDDTDYMTWVSVVNLSSAPGTVMVAAYDDQGNPIGNGMIPLAGNAKMSAPLRSLPGMTGVAGAFGTVQFTAAGGNSIAVLGLRYNGNAFAAIPTTNR